MGHVINLNTYFKEPYKRIFDQLTIVDHTHHLWGLLFWPLKQKQTPLPLSHLTCCDNMLHCIIFIKYFIQTLQKHKFWKFISYWNFVQMKWFDFSLLKNSIMYIITVIFFWKCKIIWTIFFEYHYLITF